MTRTPRHCSSSNATDCYDVRATGASCPLSSTAVRQCRLFDPTQCGLEVIHSPDID